MVRLQGRLYTFSTQEGADDFSRYWLDSNFQPALQTTNYPIEWRFIVSISLQDMSSFGLMLLPKSYNN